MIVWFRQVRLVTGSALVAAIVLALLAGAMGGAAVSADTVPPAWPAGAATPNCPGPLGVSPEGACAAVKIHGNTYNDANHNGRYDPNTGDSRLAGMSVRLVDAATDAVLAQAVTNADGYFAFPGLPLGPVFRVEVLVPAGYRPTTPTWREVEARDFSTFWCCSARVDFGFLPGRGGPTPPPPPPPVTGQGTPVPPPCCENPPGQQVHLPILNYGGNENVCDSFIEVQNVGAWNTKAMLVVWGAPGFCPPQCSGPLKVECSGLIAPGSTWNFTGAQLPPRAKSAMVFSAPAIDITGPGGGVGDVFADRLCEALFHKVVGNCDEFRRFKKAYNERGVWAVDDVWLDFGTHQGASLAVEVVRKCPGDLNPTVSVTGGYAGLSDEMLGAYDPVYGGYAFFAPLVYGDRDGLDSWLYIQNGGIECSSIEIWFRAQNDCLRPKVCDVLTLAPGETHQFDAATCVGQGWIGSAWVRASQPLGIVVDTFGRDTLTSYRAYPSELKYSVVGQPTFTTGSQVLYGPLIYSEYQGWDSLVQVQNLSGITNAKVKVYFLDRSGGIITTLSDWLCPGGSQGFYLPVMAEMPGNWVGSVRVESQSWFVPGQPEVAAPNVTAVAQLVKYSDVTRAQPLEAIAYDLFPEQRAFDWQLGSGWGGLYSGVGRIGIPSFMKDVGGSGLTTEIAIANLVPKPGFTDFVIYIYDQNGLVSSLCEKLNEKQVEYLDVGSNMAFIPEGFKGSAVISALFWEHDVFDGGGGFQRNLVGLAAVKIERTGTRLGADIPGDESAGSQGFPIIGPFKFSGPHPSCPGVPRRVPCCPPPPGARTPAPPTTAPPYPTVYPPTSLPPPPPTSGFPTTPPGVPTPPGPPVAES